MIYLDNAATTFKKPKNVYKAVEKCIRTYSANPGRSGHRLSLKATEAVYDARERVAAFFRAASPENVVFTYNATYALNMAIKTMINHKCHVIISDMEHNSVFRPIYKLSQTIGVEYSIFNSGAKDIYKEIESHIREDTEFIVCSLVSNVTGRVVPLEELSKLKKKYGIFVIADAAQAAGHMAINLSKTPVDAIAAPGHKALFGIMGSGICIFERNVPRSSFIDGGSGSESQNPMMPTKLPEALEGGTLGLPGIISVAEGIKFIESIGVETICERVEKLTREASERLLDVGAKIYGAENGVASFTMSSIGNAALAQYLDNNDVCVRSGLHCSPLAHSALGTLEGGTVRMSLSYFNTTNELDKVYKILRRI